MIVTRIVLPQPCDRTHQRTRIHQILPSPQWSMKVTVPCHSAIAPPPGGNRLRVTARWPSLEPSSRCSSGRDCCGKTDVPPWSTAGLGACRSCSRACRKTERQTGGQRIVAERLDGSERKLGRASRAQRRKLLQDVGRRRDD